MTQQTPEIDTDRPETPEIGFLRSRLDWLRVEPVIRDNGGVDIALIIDGTYAPAYLDEGGDAGRRELCLYFAQEIADALGVAAIPIEVPR